MKKLFYVFLSAQSLFSSLSFAADGLEPMPQRDSGMWQTMVMVAVAIAFCYFTMVRPEQKRRKALDEKRNSMKQGDRVTAVGIVGTIVRIQEQTVILKMYDGSKIEVLKGAINDVFAETDEEVKKVEKEERPSSKRVEITDLKS